MTKEEIKTYLETEKANAEESISRIHDLIKEADMYGLDFRHHSESILSCHQKTIDMCNKNLKILETM